MIAELGLKLKRVEMTLDSQPLLRLVLKQFFGDPSALVDMVVNHLPSPIDGARKKVPALAHTPIHGSADWVFSASAD